MRMLAGYQLLPTTDPDGNLVDAELGGSNNNVARSKVKAWFYGVCRLLEAHADALDSGWLTDLERLGGPVFAVFMVLRCTSYHIAVEL